MSLYGISTLKISFIILMPHLFTREIICMDNSNFALYNRCSFDFFFFFRVDYRISLLWFGSRSWFFFASDLSHNDCAEIKRNIRSGRVTTSERTKVRKCIPCNGREREWLSRSGNCGSF